MNLHSLAFIALGSNLGTSETSVRRAMDQLEQFSAKPLLRSSLWQTTPLDCPPDSPRFVNAVAGLTPRHEESPESLLKKLQEMEIEAGRPAKRAKFSYTSDGAKNGVARLRGEGNLRVKRSDP